MNAEFLAMLDRKAQLKGLKRVGENPEARVATALEMIALTLTDISEALSKLPQKLR